jgi:RNA polymerase sigma factor (TIGR02999 family)
LADSRPEDITAILIACREGDESAQELLISLIYDDLRQMAHRKLCSARPGQTLNTTALVNEAYLKLLEPSRLRWADRYHFFAVAARAMRHILVDYAKRRQAAKRGGDHVRVELGDVQIRVEDPVESLIALDQALASLAELDERLIQVVECRFFAGLTEVETAHALGVSRRTVQRDWLRARAWLMESLG